MRRILLAAAAASLLCAGILVTVPGNHSTAFAVASSPDLNAHVVSSSHSVLTVGWTATAGLGYVLQVDGTRVSNTWDTTMAQTRFAIKNGSHVYGVLSVQAGPSGSLTYPAPVTTTTAPTTTHVTTTAPTTTAGTTTTTAGAWKGDFVSSYVAASAGATVTVPCGTYGQVSFNSDRAAGANVVFVPASPGCVTTAGWRFSDGGSYVTARGLNINDQFGAIDQGGTEVRQSVTFDQDVMDHDIQVSSQNVNWHLVNGLTMTGNTIGPTCCGTGGNSPEGIRIGTPGGGNSSNVLLDGNLIQYPLRTASLWPAALFGPVPGATCAQCHDDGIHIWGCVTCTISNNNIVGAEVQGIFLEPTNGSLNKDITISGNRISVIGGNAGISVEATASNSTAGTWTISGNVTKNLIVIGGGFSGVLPGTVFNLTGNTGELEISNSSGDAEGCAGEHGVKINYSGNTWLPVGGGTDGCG